MTTTFFFIVHYSELNNISCLGSGGGSVGKTVASDTRGPRFQSQIGKVLLNFFTVKGIEKTKIKKKRQGVAHLKNISCFQYSAGDNRFPLKIIVFCFHSLS